MFFILNKDKIYSYIIAVLTVVALFAVSNLYLKEGSSIKVSGNIVNEINSTQNEINIVN